MNNKSLLSGFEELNRSAVVAARLCHGDKPGPVGTPAGREASHRPCSEVWTKGVGCLCLKVTLQGGEWGVG